MGRAERRKLELKSRREYKKNMITMSRQELSDIKRNIIEEYSNFGIEAFITCFALTNRRLYGHGKQRTLRTLEYINKLMDDILSDKATMDDYKKELEKGAGIIIKCD